MDKYSLGEMAFLASLNDSQTLKKAVYINYFKEPRFLHNLYDDFIQRNSVEKIYPSVLKPIISKSDEIRDRNLLDFYKDIINEYRYFGVHIIPISCSEYPKGLTKISDPPLMLYVKGDPKSILKKSIAVVGTRKISPFGIEMTRKIVKECVDLGFVIVSGLALGTDTQAHKAAIAYGGETIAVLPSDVNHVVPTENQDLAKSIVGFGSLVSEITHFAKMHKGRYIERNRLTCALSDGVIVIETGETGGSIRQAEIAIKQGKPVYTIKTDSNDHRTELGYKKLVSLGATPVEGPDDLIKLLKNRVSGRTIPTLADF